MPVVFRTRYSAWKCVQDWSRPDYLLQAAVLPHRKYRQFTGDSAESGRLHLTDGKAIAKMVTMSQGGSSSDGLYLLGIHESVANAYPRRGAGGAPGGRRTVRDPVLGMVLASVC